MYIHVYNYVCCMVLGLGRSLWLLVGNKGMEKNMETTYHWTLYIRAIIGIHSSTPNFMRRTKD